MAARRRTSVSSGARGKTRSRNLGTIPTDGVARHKTLRGKKSTAGRKGKLSGKR